MAQSPSLPLTTQIATRLATEIFSGSRKPHEQLPTEPELMRMTGASRVTVRRALQVLEDRGMIVRRPGKGTFVLPRSVPYDPRQGFIEAMVRSGVGPDLRLLHWGVVDVPPSAAKALGQTQALLVTRQFLLNGKPFGVAFAYLIAAAAVVPKEKYEVTPTQKILESVLGYTLARVTITAAAELAGKRIAPLINARPTSPVLVLERVTQNEADEPLEYALFYFRSESYRFSFSMSNGTSEPHPDMVGVDSRSLIDLHLGQA